MKTNLDNLAVSKIDKDGVKIPCQCAIFWYNIYLLTYYCMLFHISLLINKYILYLSFYFRKYLMKKSVPTQPNKTSAKPQIFDFDPTPYVKANLKES